MKKHDTLDAMSSLGTGMFSGLALLCVFVGIFSPHVAGEGSMGSSIDASGPFKGDIPPERVAVLAPVVSQYVAVAGGVYHVRAVSKFARASENKGAFRFVFPRLSTLPLLATEGTTPDPELVLKFAPDIVLAWRGQSDALQETGYPGLVDLEFDNKEGDTKWLWQLLARLVRQKARAEQLWQTTQLRQHALIATLPPAKATSVLVMRSGEVSGVWVGRKIYFLSQLLAKLGAVNPAADTSTSWHVSPEQILLYDPGIIFVPGNDVDDDLSSLYSNPMWQALRAVREKRVYLVPAAGLFNVPVEQTPLLFWLAEILHPSLLPTTRDVYRRTYAQVYHHNLTDAEINAALYISANSVSVGYERFRAAP